VRFSGSRNVRWRLLRRGGASAQRERDGDGDGKMKFHFSLPEARMIAESVRNASQGESRKAPFYARKSQLFCRIASISRVTSGFARFTGQTAWTAIGAPLIEPFHDLNVESIGEANGQSAR
jgi:hypothetical protein